MNKEIVTLEYIKSQIETQNNIARYTLLNCLRSVRIFNKEINIY